MISKELSRAMTTKEAAVYLGNAAGTLANWRRSGKGPDYLKIGGKVRYTKKSLDEFVRMK